VRLAAKVFNQIDNGQPDEPRPVFRWLVRRNGGRLWGWVRANNEREARAGLREEGRRRGIKLTLGSRSPDLRLVPLPTDKAP